MMAHAVNIKDYMQNIGIEARKASRLMASADTNQKNIALKAIANAILRGGSEALHCNQALAKLVQEGLAAANLPATWIQVIAVSYTHLTLPTIYSV